MNPSTTFPEGLRVGADEAYSWSRMRFHRLSAASVMFALYAAVFAADSRSPDHPSTGGAYQWGREDEVWIQPWGNAGTWWADKLFWQDSDELHHWESQIEADNTEASGRYASIGAGAWLDTYIAGLPTGPNGEGGYARGRPASRAYSDWHRLRDDLMGRDVNGAFNFYLLGWISPATPLDPADCGPAGANTPHGTYGDLIAERMATLSAMDHYSGYYAADLLVNMPNLYISGADFHPRNLEAFEQRLGYPLPGTTAPEKARHIRAHLMPEWADYWCDAYGHYFAEIAKRIETLRGRPALVGGQIYGDVTLTRWLGGDMRRYLKLLPPERWYFDLEMQGDWIRSVNTAGFYTSTVGTACAWEPSMWLGSKMDVFDDVLTSSLEFSGLPRVAGDAVQHTHWFQIVFTHVATREGTVRRGVTALEYGYGMSAQGNVDPRIRAAMYNHIPRKPFGPGFYYSEAMVRSFEREGVCWKVNNEAARAFDTVGCGYFATDAALENLGPATAPACWIVLRQDRLPAAERAKLEAVAPVVTPEQAAALTPVRTSAGANAWGFIDQEGRLVVVVANLARGDNAVQVDLANLVDGAYAPTDALTGAVALNTSASGGRARFTLNLADYDTRVLVFPASAVATN